MKKLALIVATVLVAFIPVAAQAHSDHNNSGNGASAQRIDWD